LKSRQVRTGEEPVEVRRRERCVGSDGPHS
jgi:hypothetical protein